MPAPDQSLRLTTFFVALLLTTTGTHCEAAGAQGEATATQGAAVRLPVTQDNSIVLVDGEWEHNAGQQGRMRIKGNQHLVAMAFDMTAVVGRRIRTATLVCEVGEQTISGVSISTIATPWDEYRSSGLSAGIDGIPDWGYPGARFPAVCGGNGMTLVHASPSKIIDGKYHWNVSPDMVTAMALGVAHGLAIHEHDADYSRNPTIYSREQSGRQPYLLVELDESESEPEPAPLPATDLQLRASDSEGALLILSAPRHGFAYDVLIDGQPLPRHNIPLCSSGQRQIIWLRDLPPDSGTETEASRDGSHLIQVITRSRTGQKSAPASLRGRVRDQAVVPRPLVDRDENASPTGSAPLPGTSAAEGISVIPVTDKYDRMGKSIGDLPDDYRTHNSIFDGRQIRLTAAAGEVVGFQLLLRGDADVSVSVELDRLQAAIELWQAVYVPAEGRLIPDPVLPMPQTIRLSPQSDQSIIADLRIPFDTPAGAYRGEVIVSDGRRIPLQVQVHAFALPEQATFFCEMNGYGLPDHVEEYYALQQVACDHRLHVNILHYSHNTAAPGSRKSNMDMLLSSGRRMDNRRYDDIAPGSQTGFWDDFAEAFGPCLDGTLFANGHRGRVPVPGFYLTFHESWPLNCRAYFNGNPDAFEAFADHPEYARTYINILQDFRRMAESQGWTQPGFQVYFNNKGALNDERKAPWILDEPTSFWDYRALRYYGELTDQSRTTAPTVNVNYRIDISRPEFCRGQLDNRNDLWIVSTWAFQHYRRLVTDRIQKDGLQAWVYGTANPVDQSNRNMSAWALDAWRDGATGIVPWQTIDKTGRALQQADQLGLLIFNKDSNNQTVIRHSLRLKAFREAQQLIEYLNLLQQKRGWSRSQLRRFVNQYVSLDAQVQKDNEADAGTTAYGGITASELDTLRLAAAQLLNEAAGRR